jgi:phosphoenolpyruvate carboxykinase (ATP)
MTATKTTLDLSKALKNLKTAQLYEEALKKGEAVLSDRGALCTYTGKHTGRAAQDKFIVKDDFSKDIIDWGEVNKAISPELYAVIREEFIAYANKQEQLYVQDCVAGADPSNSINVRVITQKAWHSLFIRNMLAAVNTKAAELSYGQKALDNYVPEYTVIDMGDYQADTKKFPELHSPTFILVNFSTKEVLIAGTLYAGEIKKSVFSILNFIYPQKGIMPMHCSANSNPEGEVSIFFGLSGTGKTTLSADTERWLIGDDEHGWSSEGVFNFENGCYAKTAKLNEKSEPEIYHASGRFGVVIENVFMNSDKTLNYDDVSITENGRVSYPLAFIPNAKSDRFVRKAPKNIIMLTCDAFGVLPAVSKLTSEDAKQQFLLGYTARIAGTEIGVKEPTAVFSACFGAPFMPLKSTVYGDLLAKKISESNVNCWLVNTGWQGGAYGTGQRMPLELTRKIIHGINSGELAKESTSKHSIFGFEIPNSIAMPETFWADKEAYSKTALKLSEMFKEKIKLHG